MFRILILMMALFLVPMSCMAEAPFTFTDDLTASYTWPEGSSEAEASYVYRVAYPQIAGDSAVAITINNVFQYELSDALGFECPMIGSDHDASQGQMQVTLDYEISHLSSNYLSVRIEKKVVIGEHVTRTIKAYTFSLTGDKAGTVTSLPHLLGLMKPGETDEWYVDRQTAKADACARDMVWTLLEKDIKSVDSIYDDLTFEEFECYFYPEEDFHLDSEGNFVFFLQEGVVAPEEAGPFFYTITMDEMLDEI